MGNFLSKSGDGRNEGKQKLGHTLKKIDMTSTMGVEVIYISVPTILELDEEEAKIRSGNQVFHT
jgi:hypothetical protein